jgi:hypothetical protein
MHCGSDGCENLPHSARMILDIGAHGRKMLACAAGGFDEHARQARRRDASGDFFWPPCAFASCTRCKSLGSNRSRSGSEQDPHCAIVARAQILRAADWLAEAFSNSATSTHRHATSSGNAASCVAPFRTTTTCLAARSEPSSVNVRWHRQFSSLKRGAATARIDRRRPGSWPGCPPRLFCSPRIDRAEVFTPKAARDTRSLVRVAAGFNRRSRAGQTAADLATTSAIRGIWPRGPGSVQLTPGGPARSWRPCSLRC